MSAPAAPQRRSTRGRSAFVVLVLALVAGACALPTWVTATGLSPLAGQVAVRVSGSAAAPVVPATALVLAAAGVAAALAGRAGRWVVVAVVIAGGIALAVAGGGVIADPAGPGTDAVAAHTGVDHLVGPATATAFPAITVGVGVVVVLVGALLVRWSAAWSAPSSRHERAAGQPVPVAVPDERSDWDALTRGADPSDEL